MASSNRSNGVVAREKHTLSTMLLTLFCVAVAYVAQAAVKDSVTVELKANFTASPCEVDYAGGAGGVVALGPLAGGTNELAMFVLTITCPYNRPTSLSAQVIKGAVNATSSTQVDMINTSGGRPVLLKLVTPEKPAGVTYNTEDTFCSGRTTRDCELTPIVTVNPGTIGGDVSAAIRFTMAYP